MFFATKAISTPPNLEELVPLAVDGDERALSTIVEAVQTSIYNLSVRMLGDTTLAQDATQEILIRVITHLSTFRAESALKTWVHRIAINHLLNTLTKNARLETSRSFERFGEQIDRGVSRFDRFEARLEEHVHRNEVLLSCTHAMLMCLTRHERVAYILGAILDLDSPEAADLLEISPATFRKRLSRASNRLEVFMKERCGVLTTSNPCRCAKQAPLAEAQGALDPCNLKFATEQVIGRPFAQAGQEEREFVGLMQVAHVFRLQPTYAPPDVVARGVRAVLKGERGPV